MNEEFKNNELFRASHVMILVCYTFSATLLILESILLGWETWAMLLVLMGMASAWVIHIQQTLSEYTRLWIYSLLMMATYFFYGIHQTSIFDLAAVMLTIIMLFIMTGVLPLVRLCQITFCLTFAFDVVGWIQRGEDLSVLNVTRMMLHVGIIFVAGWIGRVIIERWGRVLGRGFREITQLRETTQRLNDFLANVSHEIRTPANAIIGFSGVCIEKEDNEEIKRDMESVMAAGRKISDQISDILDYSEIDSRSLSVSREDYILASVIYDVVAQLSPLMDSSCELVIDVDPAVPSVMNTDAGKLKKILRHLIENAMKYTSSGGVYVHIYPIREEYGLNLHIDVTDTGIGMDEEEIERALNGFYQGDSSRTRKGGGLGLGLSIVAGFVSSLGGFMTLNSRPGEGTRVGISLPQKTVDTRKGISIEGKDTLCLASYVRFDKFSDPDVREYYGRLIKTIIGGFDVRMYPFESLAELKKFTEEVEFTHFFVGREEYEEDIPYMESLAKNAVLILAARKDYVLPPSSNAVLLPKPITSFQVAELLNTKPGVVAEDNRKMCLSEVRALVVDDEPMNLSVARGILGRYRMNVDTVSSGYEAIDACEENDYDIVFMDHMMPGMDGIEAARKIRRGGNYRKESLAIVALTANAVSTAKEMFISEGFDGFISKPIETGELERVLKKILPKEKVSYVDAPREKGSASAAKSSGGAETAAAAVTGDAGTSAGVSGGTASATGTDGTASATGTDGTASATGTDGTASATGTDGTASAIDTEYGLSYFGGDEEFYHSILLQFCGEADEKESNLTAALEKEDHRGYEIIVHALKGTAKMIGALRLSDLARELELKAAHREDIPEESHGELLAVYRDVRSEAAKILGIDDEEEVDHTVYTADDILEFDVIEDDDTSMPAGFEFAAEEDEADATPTSGTSSEVSIPGTGESGDDILEFAAEEDIGEDHTDEGDILEFAVEGDTGEDHTDEDDILEFAAEEDTGGDHTDEDDILEFDAVETDRTVENKS